MDRLIAPYTVPSAKADRAPGQGAPFGAPGWATDGNPAAGIPATIWPSYQYNAIQDELTGVISAAGLALNRDDNTQLLAALRALFAPAGGSFNPAVSGYLRLANGFMLQWGNGATVTGSGDAVFYPVAYPRGSFGQVVTEANAAGWNDVATGNTLPTLFGTSQFDNARFRLWCARFRPNNTPIYTAGTSYFFVSIGW